MKKLVIIIDGGRIEDVITSSKEPTDIRIVDFDKKTLDQSVLAELKTDYEFEDVAALADIYTWNTVYDPKKVKGVFAVNRGQETKKADLTAL